MEGTTKPDTDGNVINVKLNQEETLDFIHNKLRTTVEDLKAGTTPEHIDLKRKDITKATEAGHAAAEKTRNAAKDKSLSQSDWNKKWASLKPGQTMVGLDGKTYKKK
jgi:hypothetical protein